MLYHGLDHPDQLALRHSESYHLLWIGLHTYDPLDASKALIHMLYIHLHQLHQKGLTHPKKTIKSDLFVGVSTPFEPFDARKH